LPRDDGGERDEPEIAAAGTGDAGPRARRRAAREEGHMAEIQRISAEEARRRRQAGQALLVCAYEDDSKCRAMALEGAITVNELKRRLPSLPKSQELIFYCA
jgi:hypothetical protein